MNVVEALSDPQLFGGLPAFQSLETWRPWLAFVKTAFGLPLDASELAIFQTHTGRKTPRPEGFPEAVAIVGVQSGKSRIAAVLADHAAIAGEPGTHALLLGQDHRGAMRVLLRYAREPFEQLDQFKAEVVRETTDTLELRSGVSLSAYPCRPGAVRGLRASIVVIDELAFFTATDGRPTDTEMLRVARGRVATTGGKVIVISSPYGSTGALWQLHRQHYGRDDSSTLVWVASSPEMNPTLPQDYLTKMAEDDPEAYRSEVLGEFRASLTTLLDPDALDACVVRGRRELAPVATTRYVAFVDPSGGRSDAFTLAIGHRSADTAVVDVARAWPAPFNPSCVVEEAVSLLRLYRVGRVVGDKYAGEWPREQFRSKSIAYDVAERDKSALYLGLLPVINSGSVELPDLTDVQRELRGLERRRGASGRDRVDHRPGSHDDLANAVAGLVSLLGVGRDPSDIGLTVGTLSGYRDADGVLR